jgi:hypothetical protein
MNCILEINEKTLDNFDWPKNPPRAKSRVDEPFVFTLPNIKLDNYKKNRVFEIEKFFKGDKNSLTLTNDFYKNDNDKFNYSISLDIIEFVDIDRIIKETPRFDSVKLMKTLNEQTQNDALFLNTKISLLDVFTQTKRIDIPVRSVNCNHYQVFDLRYYLSIHKISKAYNCPVCKRKAVNLYVDGILDNWMKVREFL